MPTPIESAAQVVEQGIAVWEAWGVSVDQINAWQIGTVDGGPSGDGKYPLTNRAGTTVYVLCPAAIAELAEGGGDPSLSAVIDLAVAGIDTTGTLAGQKAAIEAVVQGALDDYPNVIGRELRGAGVYKLDETIDLKHANADLAPSLRFQAVAGFTGTMVTSGRKGQVTNNTSLGTPTRQTLFAWGGDRTTGMQPNITGFEINNEISPGSRHHFIAAYCGIGVIINGNCEKQRFDVSASYCRIAFKMAETSDGSSDSSHWTLTTTNCNRVYEQIRDIGGSSEMSGIVDHIHEAITPTNPPTPWGIEQTNKFMWHRGMVRGQRGQTDSEQDGFVITQAGDEGASSVRHDIGMTTGGGRCFTALKVRHLMGDPHWRECTNGGVWNVVTGTVDDNRTVSCSTVVVGRAVSAAAFRPIIFGNIADRALQYGTDEFYPVHLSTGDAVVSMGGLIPGAADGLNNNPRAGIFPFNRVGTVLHRAEKCFFRIAECQGRLDVRVGVVECSFELPSNFVQTGYGGTLHPDASFAGIIRGGVTLDEAVNSPLVKAMSGEQLIRFECITDLDGHAMTVKRGLCSLEGDLRVSTLALQAQSSPLNRIFRHTGVAVRPYSGTSAGKAFVAQADGSWEAQKTGVADITPVQMAQTTALLARMGVAPSTARTALLDSLLFDLADMALIPSAGGGGVLGHLFAGHDAAASRLSLFQAASGTWYDTTEAGAPVFTAGRGYALQPAIVTVLSAPADGTGMTFTDGYGTNVSIGFRNYSSSASEGWVDRRGTTAQIAQAIYAAIGYRNGNGVGYFAANVAYNAGASDLRLGGSYTAITHSAGAAMSVSNWGRLASTYDMSGSNAEGLSPTDLMMVAVSSRNTPGYAGSQNGYEFDPGNGRTKLRLRNGNAQGSAGALTTIDFPAGAALLPFPKIFGSLGAAQFGVDGGRIVMQGARTVGAGTPDILSFGGGREVVLVLLLRASDLVDNVGGVIRPKDERLLRLHRACIAAHKAAQAL